MTEQEQRAAILTEARSWIGTPYRHRGRIKGRTGCVDCAQFVWAVFYAGKMTAFMDHEEYPQDWYCHRDRERFLEIITERARETETPQAADVVLFKVGRLFSHGGIILEPGWPYIIHASAYARQVTEDRADGGWLAGRERRFFTLW